MTESKRKLPAADPVRVADQLHSAALHLLRRLRARDSATGVGPAQLSALSVLVFGGPRSLGELADAEQVKPPTMSRIVSGLESAALVRRLPTSDRRQVRLEATAKGTKILQEGRRRRVESLAAALEQLSRSEIRQLAEATAVLDQVVRML
jgi:DNA-binding MarR family transcriptional regulator